MAIRRGREAREARERRITEVENERESWELMVEGALG